MLTAIGSSVANAQSYTQVVDTDSIEVQTAQGNTDDTLKLQIWDPLSTYTIQTEDEIHLIDETDPNLRGWPSVNLLQDANFEGTYTAGVAASWLTATSAAIGGTITYAKNTTAGMFGANSQSVTWSNIANGGWIHLYQPVTIPTNEVGTPLTTMPYFLSAWYFVTTACVSTNVQFLVNCYNSTGGSLGTLTSPTLTNPGASASWQRLMYQATLPAGTATINYAVQIISSSATNSGAISFDGAQFEYATFGAYRSAAFQAENLDNPFMDYAATTGQTVAPGWNTDGSTTGVTYSLVSYAGNNSQEIACASVAASSTTRAISQSAVIFNPNQVYQVKLAYQCVTALAANSQVRVGFQYSTANGTFINDYHVNGPAGEPISTGWEYLTFYVGPGTSFPPPVGAATCKLYAGIVNNTAAHTETVAITTLALYARTQQYQTANAGVDALTAGMYPSRFIDPSHAGNPVYNVWLDREVTNFYYRAQRIFGGFVRHSKKTYTGSAECMWDIDAVDFGVTLSEAVIVMVLRGQNLTLDPFSGITDSAAINAACTYAHNQGYLKGLDWTTHVANLTTIPAMAFNWTTVKDALSSIADVTIGAYWVDPYRYLWYQAAISQTAGFSISNTPNMVTSFPYEEFTLDADGSQTRTTAIIQGGQLLTSPQTSPTMYGYVGATAQTITSGTNYTTVVMTPNASRISSGTGILFGTSSSGQLFVTETDILPTPTVTPTVGTNATTSTFTSGNVTVAYSYVYKDYSTGLVYETLNSQSGTVSVTGTTQSVAVSSINPPVSGATSAAGLVSINVYVSISAGSLTLKRWGNVAATNNVIPAFTISAYGTGASPITNVQIPVIPVQASTGVTSGGAATAILFTVNGGAPLYNITSVTVNGVAQKVGLASSNTSGFDCYSDLQPATVTFDPASFPANNAAIVVVYTFQEPVLIRVTAPSSSTIPYSGQRKIAFYQNVTNIQSISDAIDMANAQLAQFSKPQPIARLTLHWPPCPISVNPHHGLFFSITNPPALGTTSPVSFQIQRCTTKVMGNGVIKRTFELGYYRPDLATQMSQVTQDASHLATDVNASSILNDVLTSLDSWTMTDAVTGATSNTAIWGTNAYNDGTTFG